MATELVSDEKEMQWCYHNDGTSEWGLHFPEANGDSQSPININSRDALYDESLNHNPLDANYMLCRECEITNTGQTVQVSFRYKADPTISTSRDVQPESMPRSVMSCGPLPEGFEYELTEFCFHWGKDDAIGSEHTVNFKAYPMELHLIHWNSTLYNSLEEAMGKPNGICIVALFIQIGREHTGLRMLTDNLETVQHKILRCVISGHMRAPSLLRHVLRMSHGFYSGTHLQFLMHSLRISDE